MKVNCLFYHHRVVFKFHTVKVTSSTKDLVWHYLLLQGVVERHQPVVYLPLLFCLLILILEPENERLESARHVAEEADPYDLYNQLKLVFGERVPFDVTIPD